jgi:hypothetical protein
VDRDKDLETTTGSEHYDRSYCDLATAFLVFNAESNARAKTIADTAVSLWQNDHRSGVFELEFCEQVIAFVQHVYFQIRFCG